MLLNRTACCTGSACPACCSSACALTLLGAYTSLMRAGVCFWSGASRKMPLACSSPATGAWHCIALTAAEASAAALVSHLHMSYICFWRRCHCIQERGTTQTLISMLGQSGVSARMLCWKSCIAQATVTQAQLSPRTSPLQMPWEQGEQQLEPSGCMPVPEHGDHGSARGRHHGAGCRMHAICCHAPGPAEQGQGCSSPALLQQPGSAHAAQSAQASGQHPGLPCLHDNWSMLMTAAEGEHTPIWVCYRYQTSSFRRNTHPSRACCLAASSSRLHSGAAWVVA